VGAGVGAITGLLVGSGTGAADGIASHLVAPMEDVCPAGHTVQAVDPVEAW